MDAPNTSLSGNWQGHYTELGTPHRIVAEFTQDADWISGRMTDLDTISEMPLDEFVVEAGLPPGTEEIITAQVRDALPAAPRGSITTRSILPSQSELTGHVDKHFVRFTKTYRGESEHQFQIGDQVMSSKQEPHSVDYEGRLSDDGRTITGRWSILTTSGGITEGDFELHRV